MKLFHFCPVRVHLHMLALTTQYFITYSKRTVNEHHDGKSINKE